MSEAKETIFEHDTHTVASTGSTLTVFVVLVLLAIVAIAVGFSDLGPWKVAASLLVAGVQALVLSVFFMDLKQADKLTWMCAGASVFWVAIMFTFTLTDYVTRHLAAF